MDPQPPNPPTLDQELYKKRVAEFDHDLVELQKKHNLVIVPVLVQSEFGILPQVIYMPREEYDKRMNKQPSQTAN